MSNEMERLRALVEMSAELSERLHRKAEAAAYRRVLDMIDGLIPDETVICPVCFKGRIENEHCTVCGIKVTK